MVLLQMVTLAQLLRLRVHHKREWKLKEMERTVEIHQPLAKPLNPKRQLLKDSLKNRTTKTLTKRNSTKN